MGLGFGGVNVAGGHKKSYYIKVGEEVAYKLKSKKYKKEWKNIFSECTKIDEAFNDKMKWKDFSQHIHHYTTECN